MQIKHEEGTVPQEEGTTAEQGTTAVQTSHLRKLMEVVQIRLELLQEEGQ